MNITTGIRLSIFGLSVICSLGAGVHSSAAGDDPTIAPVPDLNEIGLDTRRAIVIEALVLADGTTSLLDAVVSDVPPGAVDDDPPLLLLEALDASGVVLQSFNTWDPRWEYQVDENGQEEGVPVEDGEESGIFDVPFDHRIAVIRLQDQQTDPVQVLADFDVSTLVEDFCIGNPDDPNCDGFTPGASDQDGDGIADDADACPGTTPGDEIDASGCSAAQRDTDSDGVSDALDVCPGTAFGDPVDASGCSAAQRDTDGDGISDAIDSCPATPAGTQVDETGCEVPQGGRACDVDLDNDVDKYDIFRIIFSPNRRDLDPGDPRDPNENGRIDFFDIFICIRECDRRHCATQ